MLYPFINFFKTSYKVMAFPHTDDIMFGSSLAFSTALSEYPLVISLFLFFLSTSHSAFISHALLLSAKCGYTAVITDCRTVLYAG